MKVKEIEIVPISIPLRTTFKTALRTVHTLDNIAVKITTDTGIVGIGEASPTAAITGETAGSISYVILKHIKPSLVGLDFENFEGIMHTLHTCIIKNTSAKAAVDMALYDILAQSYSTPLYRLLGGYREELETDITISLNGIETMVRDSVEAVNRGFSILKIKVGNTPSLDVKRIVEIRKAIGKEPRLRIDANQGWSAKDAIQIIRHLEDLDVGMELVEQPVKSNDFKGLKQVTEHTYTKILADESVFSPSDAIQLIHERAADIINIKLMKTGGIYQALQICAIAEANDVECMMGCMLESKISVSAAAHLAAAKKVVTMVDLDGPALCQFDVIDGGPLFNHHLIQMSQEQGLGFDQKTFLLGGVR